MLYAIAYQRIQR